MMVIPYSEYLLTRFVLMKSLIVIDNCVQYIVNPFKI